MAKTSNHQSRLQIAKIAELKYDQGHKYFKAKQYKRALDCLLFAFDNGHLVSGWGGVRLSYIPSTIAEIGKYYPLALQELGKRRDAREILIESGESDFSVIGEWSAINRYLDVENYELDFLARMEKEKRVSAELRERIISENKEVLLLRQEYNRLGKYLNRFAWFFLHAVTEYVQERDFPTAIKGASVTHREILLQSKAHARKLGAECFEIALGCGRLADAKKVMSYLLMFFDDQQTYAALIKAAQATGQKRMEKKLHQVKTKTKQRARK